jgi:hypothetical protein
MNSKVISPDWEATKIDWTKPGLYCSDDGMVILSTGQNMRDVFTGTVLVANCYYAVGIHSDAWAKDEFSLITKTISIEFNP